MCPDVRASSIQSNSDLQVLPPHDQANKNNRVSGPRTYAGRIRILLSLTHLKPGPWRGALLQGSGRNVASERCLRHMYAG